MGFSDPDGQAGIGQLIRHHGSRSKDSTGSRCSGSK